MGNDTQSTRAQEAEQQEQERLDRRQFLNGLGKWSIAIVAGVAALRDGSYDVQSGVGSRSDTPSAGRGAPRQQIARKKKPHGDQPHIDEKHSNIPTQHEDYYRIQKPKPSGGGTTPSPDGGARKQ